MSDSDTTGMVVVPSSRAMAFLLTTLRDRRTPPPLFKERADRLMVLLAEEASAADVDGVSY